MNSPINQELEAESLRRNDVAREVANAIHEQISPMTYMSLGASHRGFTWFEDKPALTFKARVLPFNKQGQRLHTARTMRVWVALNGADYYDVSVGYERSGSWVEHARADDIDCFQLNQVLLAIDFDGDTALNPRYFPA